MFTSSSCVFAVNYQARVLCAQRASKEKHRFIVGTCSLHEHNELSVLEYREETNQIDVVSTYSHPDQIWAMEPSPRQPELIVTSKQSTAGDRGVSLYRMPHQSEDDILSGESEDFGEVQQLEEVSRFSLRDSSVFVQNIKWHHSKDNILTCDSKEITLWSLTNSNVQLSSSLRPEREDDPALSNLTCGVSAWDPHSPAACAAAFGSSLNFLDTRNMEVTGAIAGAHEGVIRDVDYNPNKPMIVVTCGDDRKVKFWDVRNQKSPIKTLAGHSHWAWCVKFNPFHDQLLLSGGTDSIVNLWRIASVSSVPWIGTGDDENLSDENDPPDVKVKSIDQHEDSIYGLAWSPADAWMFCSLSYDGRAILNHVPSTEKYKILL